MLLNMYLRKNYRNRNTTGILLIIKKFSGPVSFDQMVLGCEIPHKTAAEDGHTVPQ